MEIEAICVIFNLTSSQPLIFRYSISMIRGDKYNAPPSISDDPTSRNCFLVERIDLMHTSLIIGVKQNVIRAKYTMLIAIALLFPTERYETFSGDLESEPSL